MLAGDRAGFIGLIQAILQLGQTISSGTVCPNCSLSTSGTGASRSCHFVGLFPDETLR